MQNIQENISTNLTKLKTTLNIKSFDVIGEGVNMKGQKLRRIARNEQSPKIIEVIAICDFFGVNPIDFLSKKI